MKHRIPISGYLIYEAEDVEKAARMAARWLLNLSRQNEGRTAPLPDLFADAPKPSDVAVVVDQSHVLTMREDQYRKVVAEAEVCEYKLSTELRKKEKDAVRAALRQIVISDDES